MTDPQTPPQQAPQKTRSILPFLTCLLIFIACVLSCYALLMSWENTRTIAQLSSFTKEKVMPYTELTTTLATINEAHASLQTQLSKLSQQMDAQQPSSTNQVLVGERARYYLEFAVVELTLGNNIPGCITLLKQAENLLAPLSDETLRPVFVAIQQTTQALQSFPQSNAADTLLQIHQLQKLLNKTFPAPTNTMPTSVEATPSIKQIQSLISIKHHQPSKQAEVIFQQTLLSNRIELNLQIAQAAILQHNAALYQTAIEQAIKATEDLPAATAAVQQPILSALQTLQKTPPFTQPASLDAPLKALNDWLVQQQHTLQPNP